MFERVGQRVARTAERSLHGSFRDAELGRDRGDRLVEEVVQHHDLALAAGERAEEPVHVDRGLPRAVRLDRVALGGRGQSLDRAPFGRAAADPAAREVDRDDPDPRAEDLDVVTALDPLPRAGAGLVDGVACDVGAAGDEPHGRDEPRVVEDVEVVEPAVTHSWLPTRA
jgi:hypothetical protein